MRFTPPIAVAGGVLVLFAVFVIYSDDDPVKRLNETFAISDVGFVSASGTSVHAAPVHDPVAFSQWQLQLRNELVKTFDFDELNTSAVPYTVHRIERLRGGLIREKLTFESFDGTRIPAVRQRLEQIGSGPGVLLLSGHTQPGESGLAQLVYETESYQHAAATALARAGYITLTFELRGFGLLGKPLNTEHRLVAFNALLEGSFYKKIVLTDAAYALSVLRSTQGIDTQRIGVAGASFGGELAVTLAALSDGISVVFFSGYGGSTGPFRFVSGQRENQPHYCHVIPGVRSLMRSEDVILLLAPRRVLGARGQHENRVSQKFRTATAAAWQAVGADKNFEFSIISDGVHEFFVKEAVEFFRRTLTGTNAG